MGIEYFINEFYLDRSDIMQKRFWIFVCYAFITGAFSMFLRWLQLINCFEEDTGLFISGGALTPLFIILLLISAAGMLLMAMRCRPSEEPEAALRARSPLCTVFSAVLAFVMFAGAVMLFVRAGDMRAAMLFRLLAIMGVAAAASMFGAADRMSRGRADSTACFCFTVVILFYCLWMVASYKAHDSNPVIWSYAPEILAIASGTLAWYFLAGFAFGKPKTVQTVFFSGLSFVLALTAMPDDRDLSLSILLMTPGLEALMLSWILIRNLQAENGR